MPGTVLLVHSGHKICVGQRVEQVLLIDAASKKVKMAMLTGYPRFGCIVLVPGQIDYYCSSAAFT